MPIDLEAMQTGRWTPADVWAMIAELRAARARVAELEAELETERSIVSDPDICFGAPQISGIEVEAIAGRVLAGDSVEFTAEDFTLRVLQVETAVAWWKRLGEGLVKVLDIAEREKEAAYQDRDTAMQECGEVQFELTAARARIAGLEAEVGRGHAAAEAVLQYDKAIEPCLSAGPWRTMLAYQAMLNSARAALKGKPAAEPEEVCLGAYHFAVCPQCGTRVPLEGKP